MLTVLNFVLKQYYGRTTPRYFRSLKCIRSVRCSAPRFSPHRASPCHGRLSVNYHVVNRAQGRLSVNYHQLAIRGGPLHGSLRGRSTRRRWRRSSRKRAAEYRRAAACHDEPHRLCGLYACRDELGAYRDGPRCVARQTRRARESPRTRRDEQEREADHVGYARCRGPAAGYERPACLVCVARRGERLAASARGAATRREGRLSGGRGGYQAGSERLPSRHRLCAAPRRARPRASTSLLGSVH